MLRSETPTTGYVCAPYSHDHSSVEIKDMWSHSKNVDEMFFATATFSQESKPYFSESANHYLIAKFRDNKKILKEVEKFQQDKASFIFSTDEELFERESEGEMNFVSVYYLDYSETDEDVGEVASVIAKKEKVAKAGVFRLDI